MTLPKVKEKKLIKEKEFLEIAKKVKKSLQEEEKYLQEKRLKNGSNISRIAYNLT